MIEPLFQSKNSAREFRASDIKNRRPLDGLWLATAGNRPGPLRGREFWKGLAICHAFSGSQSRKMHQGLPLRELSSRIIPR